MSVAAFRVAAVILAAGSSRRMGRPKQLLPLAGRPLLQHVVDAAAGAAVDEIVLVLGFEAMAIRDGLTLPARARVVENPRWVEGQSTSLACGLAALADEVDVALVLLGDQPGTSSALVDEVVTVARTVFLAGTATVVRPVWRDGTGAARPGHPVALARAVWPELARIGGDAGARTVFATHPEWVHELAMAGPPPVDVDDREDYRRAADARATGG